MLNCTPKSTALLSLAPAAHIATAKPKKGGKLGLGVKKLQAPVSLFCSSEPHRCHARLRCFCCCTSPCAVAAQKWHGWSHKAPHSYVLKMREVPFCTCAFCLRLYAHCSAGATRPLTAHKCALCERDCILLVPSVEDCVRILRSRWSFGCVMFCWSHKAAYCTVI